VLRAGIQTCSPGPFGGELAGGWGGLRDKESLEKYKHIGITYRN
jgi:hypothetical protein